MQGKSDACLYSRFKNNRWTFILTHVQDLVLCHQDKEDSDEIVRNLNKKIEMKDLGDICYYLGIQMEWGGNGSFFINQKQKIMDLIEHLGLTEANVAEIPMEVGFFKDNETKEPLQDNSQYRTATGKLLYTSTVTRLGIAAVVGKLCRKVNAQTKKDWTAVKRIGRYLKGTADLKLMLPANSNSRLVDYMDANWSECREDRKSTSGNLFYYGGGVISWTSKKQSVVALSSIEAKYISAAQACQEATWLYRLLLDFGINEPKPTRMHEDNKSCILLSQPERVTPQTMQIDTKYHCVRDAQQQGSLG
ncbi:uncharacterized protein LOC133363342 [Rhineura floridana]|uniref:uncharacterized protein LOC133363342 n=1 Tax=Rhineura floridana TaxID=261503 RepID=UPI002AC80C1F|nr:uncharacterized protein LOC133363342 [Rhineura floridana]